MRLYVCLCLGVCVFVPGYVRMYVYTNAERCKNKKADRYIRAVLNGTG